MNNDSQDRYEASVDALTSEVGLPATDQEQNTGQSVNISQNNECERWKFLFETQQQNMMELIRAIREPRLSSTKITLPEFNPDTPDHDARAWCETVDICLEERPIYGSDLIITMSKALKGTASSWLAQSSFTGITWPQLKDLFLARFDTVETPAANLWRLLNSSPREGECLSAFAGRFMSTILARWKSLSKEQIAIALTLAHTSKIEPRLQRIAFTTEIDSRNKLQQELMAFGFRKRGYPTSEKTTPFMEVKKLRTDNTRKCYNCGRMGHVSRECRGNSSCDSNANTRFEISNTTSSKQSKEPGSLKKTITPTCFKCGERGHIAPRCPSADIKASDARIERRVDVCSIQPAIDELLDETDDDGSSCESQRSRVRTMRHLHRASSGLSSVTAARALRLLLLLVLALAAVEYLFGSILDASPLQSYMYAQFHNNTTMIKSEKLHPLPTTLLIPVLVTNSMKNYTRACLNGANNVSIIEKNNITTKNGSGNRSSLHFIKKKVDRIKNIVTTEEDSRDKNSVPMCEDVPPDLGPVAVNKTEIELEWVEKRYPDVRSGGLYSSPNCTARHRVAIIVPYRDRQQHLAIFLNHMHPFLIKQQIEYGIYIVEQKGASEFNRAKLMNVGFIESQKQRSWQCFIFHDIDLLPLDSRNLYSCPRQPRHMSASVDIKKFRVPYEDMFGGVSAMTQEQFSRVNGFSNKYWGWGAEDDDMSIRLQTMKYHIGRYKMSIARYVMLDHEKSEPNPKRYQLLSQTIKTFLKEGLSTLEYELVKVTLHKLYTHILVNIDERS